MSDVKGEGPAAPSEPPSASGSLPAPGPTSAPAGGATGQPASPDSPGAPPAPGTPDVAVPVAPPRRRRRQRRAATAANAAKPKSKIPSVAATTAVTAVITAIVGGILSQDRIDSVLGDDDPSESSSTEAPPPDYERVSDPEGAIAVDVPRSWGATEAYFDGIAGVTSPGLGLRAGPDPMAVRFVVDETVWVGASTQAFDDLGLTELDDSAVVDLFEGRLESSVLLPRNDCTPTSKHTPELGDQWVGAVQAWQDCSSIEGWRAIEVEMISRDRDVYVYLQIGLAPSTPDEVAQRMLDSLDVLPGKLPVS